MLPAKLKTGERWDSAPASTLAVSSGDDEEYKRKGNNYDEKKKICRWSYILAEEEKSSTSAVGVL